MTHPDMRAGRNRALGVDAAGKHGWVGVVIDDGGFEAALVGSLADIIASAEPVAAIGVDIPIGSTPDGTRLADQEARAFVGKRRSSVFAAPSLATIGTSSFDEHNAVLTAAGLPRLSRQAWALMPKMAETAAVASTDPRIREVHPEASFRAMAGVELAWSKKS